MDLTSLESLANSISSSSPAIKKYAQEQVRVTKNQEARLMKIEERLASISVPTVTSLDQVASVLRSLKGA